MNSALYEGFRDRVPGTRAVLTAAVLWVEGPDAAHFLQGLLSNDIDVLRPGDAQRSLLLDERGRIQGDVRVHRDADDAFTVVLDPIGADLVAETLVRLHISEDLEIFGPEVASVEVVVGEREQARGVWVPGALDSTILVLGDEAPGDDDAAREVLDTVMVEEGVPRIGVDTVATTLVQETGLTDAVVSFSKGCYLGQETVARVKYRGAVRRGLRGLRAEVPLITGTEITHDGRRVGVTGRAVESPQWGHIALAILPHAVEDGAQIDAAGVSATVTALPFRG